eukprot:3314662-Rhodomonas_salina.1
MDGEEKRRGRGEGRKERAEGRGKIRKERVLHLIRLSELASDELWLRRDQVPLAWEHHPPGQYCTHGLNEADFP